MSMSTFERLGIGCEPLGGYQWGSFDVGEVQKAIQVSIEMVERNKKLYLDTSDTYGPELSETRLGEIIKNNDSRVFLGTKFGVRLQNSSAFYDNDPEYIKLAVERSLRRLGVERIDLYQLHWHDNKTPLTQIFDTLEELCLTHKIQQYGVCNVRAKELIPFIGKYRNLKTFSLPYSLVDREFELDIQTLINLGLRFIGYGCLAQGLLSGKYTAHSTFSKNDRRSNVKYKNFHGLKFKDNLELISKLSVLSEQHGCSMSEFALAYVSNKFKNSIVLAGIKTEAQLKENWRGANMMMDTYKIEKVLKERDIDINIR